MKALPKAVFQWLRPELISTYCRILRVKYDITATTFDEKLPRFFRAKLKYYIINPTKL